MLFAFFIYIIILFTSTIVGCYKYKKLTEFSKGLLLLVVLTSISELISLLLILNKESNFIVYHFYVVISTLSYLLILKRVHSNVLRVKEIIITSIIFPIVSFLISFFIQNPQTFPSISILISSMIIFFNYVRYLKHSVVDGLSKTKSHNNMIIAIVFYFSTQSIIWGVYSYFIRKDLDVTAISYLSYFFSLIYYSYILRFFVFSATHA